MPINSGANAQFVKIEPRRALDSPEQPYTTANGD
jgi:hypothetical protein